jgi:hypothetical protein
MIGRLIRWTIGLLVLASIGEMIAAFITKQRTPSVGDADSDEVALVTIFEPLEFTSTATAFRGGSLLCWYGGGDLDLRDASLDPDGAHLTVKVIMGGGRVLVPDEWIVETHVAPILGGVADTREARERPADAPRLILDGFTVLGGFAIMSSRPEAAIDVAETIQAAKDQASAAVDDANDAVTELVPALDV